MTSASNDRVLWGAGTFRTVRPRWALKELGLEYDSKVVVPRTDAMESDEFRSVSPRGKVPMLDDRGLLVGESGAIVLYLADRYASESGILAVAPDDYATRSAYYDLCFFIMTELDATSLYIVRRHDDLAQTYGDAPQAIASSRAYFCRQVGEIERRLADGRPYLLGDQFLATDVLLMTCLDWAAFIKIDLPTTVETYRERLAERPAYVAAMAENFAPLHELAKAAG